MKAKHCDECKHFNDEDVPGTKVCDKNHKPRWYGQKHVQDTDWGYKRVCVDFERHNVKLTGLAPEKGNEHDKGR